jgi:hypothetical protein
MELQRRAVPPAVAHLVLVRRTTVVGIDSPTPISKSQPTMTMKDYLTLAISLLALIVSLIAAARTWKSNVATFRAAARNNYMNAMFDLNRQIIAHPELWSVYDPAVLESAANTPTEQLRRRAFIWYHLNVFEVVHADYCTDRITSLNRVDQLYWKAWDNFVSYLLRSSAEAREIVTSDEGMAMLNSDFVAYLRDKARVEGQKQSPKCV